MGEAGERRATATIWKRGLYMLLFALLYSVAEVVLAAVVVVQFGYRVINEVNHPRLLTFGAALSRYLYQVFRFLSFNSERLPFPFDEWPEGEAPEPDAVQSGRLPREEPPA
jgi:hypothetical protein